MTKMSWTEERMAMHGRTLIVGHLGGPRASAESVFAMLNLSRILELPGEGNGYIYVLMQYNRDEAHKDSPDFRCQVWRCSTVEEALDEWHNQFPYELRDDPENHVTVRVRRGLTGPHIKAGDGWLLYHLGVISGLVRSSDDVKVFGEWALNRLAWDLESITASRIKQVTNVM